MTYLSEKQKQDAREWRGVGLTPSEARYRVLTPEQRLDHARQAHDADRRRHAENPRRELLIKVKHMAKHREIEFAITEADLDWPTHCPVTGVELIYGGRGSRPNGKRGAPMNAASFDRIDNARGYVPGNVVIVSYWVNTRKGDATPEQLRAIADFYSRA